jgi:hypothetical protein
LRSLYASNAGCRVNELLGQLLMHSEGIAATLNIYLVAEPEGALELTP